MKNVVKVFLLLYIPFLISACSNSIGRVSLNHNNFSDYGVYVEEVVVNGRIIGYSKDSNYSTCGNNTGGTKLSNISVPLEEVSVTWYAVEKNRTFRAEIDLPETYIQEKLLLNPPWSDFKKKKTKWSVNNRV